MSISMLNAANDQMMAMMKIMMDGMQKQAEMATEMVAVGVENAAIGDKMQMAQHIIDVYA